MFFCFLSAHILQQNTILFNAVRTKKSKVSFIKLILEKAGKNDMILIRKECLET